MEFISKQNFADFVKGLYSEYDIFYPKKTAEAAAIGRNGRKVTSFRLKDIERFCL